MSFPYRPTPTVVLSGKTVGSSNVALKTLPAGTMHGYAPNVGWKKLNDIGRRTMNGTPWIVRSGTMGEYMANPEWWRHTLGDVDTDMIDFGSELTPPTFDFGGSQILPINMTSSVPIDTTMYDPGNILKTPVFQTPTPTFADPSKMVGPSPSAITTAVAGGTSLLSSIASLFKPSPTAQPMTAAQPGVYNAYAAQPSWFSQSTLLPGTPNSTVALGGAAVVVLLLVVMGGKRK